MDRPRAAVLEVWYSGSEAGNALADVLFGAVNPSGKLPFTFPVRLEDCSAHSAGEYPGDGQVVYRDGIFVGYRWIEKERIEPLFALRPRPELYDVRHCQRAGGSHVACNDGQAPGSLPT